MDLYLVELIPELVPADETPRLREELVRARRMFCVLLMDLALRQSAPLPRLHDIPRGFNKAPLNELALTLRQRERVRRWALAARATKNRFAHPTPGLDDLRLVRMYASRIPLAPGGSIGISHLGRGVLLYRVHHAITYRQAVLLDTRTGVSVEMNLRERIDAVCAVDDSIAIVATESSLVVLDEGREIVRQPGAVRQIHALYGSPWVIIESCGRSLFKFHVHTHAWEEIEGAYVGKCQYIIRTLDMLFLRDLEEPVWSAFALTPTLARVWSKRIGYELEVSPDGSLMVHRGPDRHLEVRRTSDDSLLYSHQVLPVEGILKLSISPDNRHVALMVNREWVEVFRLASGVRVRRFEFAGGRREFVRMCADNDCVWFADMSVMRMDYFD